MSFNEKHLIDMSAYPLSSSCRRRHPLRKSLLPLNQPWVSSNEVDKDPSIIYLYYLTSVVAALCLSLAFIIKSDVEPYFFSFDSWSHTNRFTYSSCGEPYRSESLQYYLATCFSSLSTVDVNNSSSNLPPSSCRFFMTDWEPNLNQPNHSRRQRCHHFSSVECI